MKQNFPFMYCIMNLQTIEQNFLSSYQIVILIISVSGKKQSVSLHVDGWQKKVTSKYNTRNAHPDQFLPNIVREYFNNKLIYQRDILIS